MKRVALLSAIFLTVVFLPVFGQNATVTQITGKVQLLSPGGQWVDAARGSVVTPGTVVSTGFSSTAVLDLGTSQLQVRQLTRMKLEELVRSQGTVTTSLFLTVGAVHANVANNLGVTQKFTIQSPISTAAVRGTIFDFDGFTVTVDRGVVHFSNIDNLGREVAANQSSSLDGPYVPGSAEEFQMANSNVSGNTNPGGGGTPTGPAGGGSGSITVTIN